MYNVTIGAIFYSAVLTLFVATPFPPDVLADTAPPSIAVEKRLPPPPPVQLPAAARSSEHLYGLAGLENVGRVTPDIFRGSQPAKSGYATLKKMGIRTVINLRTSMSEKKNVEAAGMRSIEIPLSTFNNGDREKVDRVVALLSDPANRPVFVHCRQGRDRTGIVVAAYRMKVQGWTLAAAESEMNSFEFNDVWVNLRRFLHRYSAGLGRNGRDGNAAEVR
jgi:protein tyrosine/serine phosphatase